MSTGSPPSHPARARAAARARRRFLPEIQALRAVAVSLVVAFHLFPTGPLTRGGFVGVDVFFVISGYLITSHLLREAEATGTVRLGAFYARRARRLLPASLLVALVSAAAIPFVLPSSGWRTAAAELVASAFYVENLWLAARAVQYSAAGDVASPVQHYWSLSTEEQFYLVWPALVLGAFAWARRRGTHPVTAVGVVLGGVSLASLAASVAWTAASPSQAYFVTPTRAWEFGTGALLTLLLRRWAPGPVAARALAVAGALAVLAGSVVLSQSTPFPGVAAALPVLGTAAVILAGEPAGVVARVVEAAPVQWLGKVSYSVYLWHWPLVVAAPTVLQRDRLPWWGALGIVALTAVLSHLTQRYVEDVTVRLPRVRASSRRTLLAVLAGGVVVSLAAAGVAGAAGVAERQAAAVAGQAGLDPCLGAAGALSTPRCRGVFTERPRFAVTSAERPGVRLPGCDHAARAEGAPARMTCSWTSTTSRRIVLVGDSHAEMMRFPIAAVARHRGWALDTILLAGCTPSLTPSPTFRGAARPATRCSDWTRAVLNDVRRTGADLVVVTSFVGAVGFEPASAAVSGLHETWAALAEVAPVLVVRDAPSTGERHVPACLTQHADDPQACATPRSTALAATVEAQALASPPPGVTVLDLSRAYCDDELCRPVVGGVPVYVDRDHLTRTFADTLRPGIEPVLVRLLGPGSPGPEQGPVRSP